MVSEALQNQIRGAFLGAPKPKPVKYLAAGLLAGKVPAAEGEPEPSGDVMVDIHMPTVGQRKRIQKECIQFDLDGGNHTMDLAKQSLMTLKELVFFEDSDQRLFPDDSYDEAIMAAPEGSPLALLIEKALAVTQTKRETIAGN